MRRISYGLILGLFFAANLIPFCFTQPGDGRGKDIHFRGPVFALSRDHQGKLLQATIRVNRSQIGVLINSWTDVIAGRGFRSGRDSIALGDFLEVSGFFTSTGKIVARRIHIERADGLDLEGAVELVSGNLIQVDGIEFLLAEAALVRESGAAAPGSVGQVTVGETVRLRANRMDGVWIVAELEYGPRTVESEPLRLEGLVESQEGQLLSIDVGVQGVSALVALDQLTSIRGHLQPGVLAEIEGRFLPGTALIKASRIAVDANQNGNAFDDASLEVEENQVEVAGPIQSVNRNPDGIPTHLILNEWIIRLSHQTRVFRGDQQVPRTQLTEQQQITVHGVRLQDNSVLAFDIWIETNSTTDDRPGGTGSGTGAGGGEDSKEEGDASVNLVSFEGTISGISRSNDGSVNRIVVGKRQVHITPRTKITDGQSSVQPNSVLVEGLKVEVKGTQREDGSLLAEVVRIRND